MIYPERQPHVQAMVRAHLERLLAGLSDEQREVFGFMGLKGINEALSDNMVLQVGGVAAQHPNRFPIVFAAISAAIAEAQ